VVRGVWRRVLLGLGTTLLLAPAACRDNRVIVREFEESYCPADGERLVELGTVDEVGAFTPLEGTPPVVPVFSGWLAMSTPLAMRLRGIPPQNALANLGWDLEQQPIDEVEFDVDLVCDSDGLPEPVPYTLSIGDQYGTAEDYVEPVEGRLRVRVAPAGANPADCSEESTECLYLDEDVLYVLGET